MVLVYVSALISLLLVLILSVPYIESYLYLILTF